MNRTSITAAAVVAFTLGLAAGGGPSPEGQDKAEEIATHSFNQVQPVNFPRISAVEEQLIRACAKGTLDSNYVGADIRDEVRSYLYAELLPDGR